MKTASLPIQKIPVLVLTGFLGSGKTTLLNTLLKQMPKSTVIINEFGSTPIDPHLLREHNIPISTLSGGCLCCQVRDALAPVLKNLRMAWDAKADKPFDRIIIETSGVANPEPVLDVLLRQKWLSQRYQLQAVITTISAPHGSQNLQRYPDAHAQVAWADVIVMTHTDLADDAQIAALSQQLKQLSPTAKQVKAVQGNIDISDLMPDMLKFRPVKTNTMADLPDHGFNSIALQFAQSMDLTKTMVVLQNLIDLHGNRLVRLKGLIFDPHYDHPLLVQGSTGVLHPAAHLPARASDDFVSRLVFIVDGTAADWAADITQKLEAAFALSLIKGTATTEPDFDRVVR